MKRSVLFFCGQPLANAPISQRILSFGKLLKARGWVVHYTSVSPDFHQSPFFQTDVQTGESIEIVGPTHYFLRDGARYQHSPPWYLIECRKTVKRIIAAAEKCGAEMIYLSTSLPASLVAVAMLRGSRFKVWIDIDDWSAGQFTARGGGKFVGMAYEIFEKWLPRMSEQVTVCSKELQSLFPRSVLIPNFISIKSTPPRPAQSEYKSVRVAFASSVSAYHGHVPFLEALASRKQDLDGVEFWIFGDGDRLEQCKQLVSENGLGRWVNFTDRLSREEMLVRLVGSEIGVLPLWDNRLNRARFSLKLLDYLACGCAVAASDVGMVKEVLTQNVTGRLSRPGDMHALLDDVFTLAKDHSLRHSLIQQGLELVKGYDSERVCNQWAEVLESK